MVFKRRNSATISTESAPVKPASSHRLIDGSKPLARLIEDHLEHRWCATAMNVFIDRKGRINSFIHGDFLVQFKFSSRTDEKFIMASCLYNPKVDGKVDDIKDKFMAKQSEVTDPSIRLKMDEDGSIVLFQKVSAATMLIDEEIESTLENFFAISKSVRTTVVPKRRRLSWFQKNAE